MLTFDEVEHRYFINGDRVPGVSEILAPLSDFSRIPRDTLEAKRELGRAVHRAIELYSSDELDSESLDMLVEKYLEGWLRLLADMPFAVIATEHMVYSSKYRYAGRLDLFATLGKDLWLLDVKTVAVMTPTTALQTAAYAQAANEAGAGVKKRAGVQLLPDGTFRLWPYTKPENRRDFDVFLNALNIRRWQENNR